jgi:sulfur-oxidizing protein SoxY
MQMTRREFGAVAAGAAAFAAFGAPAFAATQEAIMAFTGGAEPAAGKVKLNTPEIAENGNTVPVEFSVDAAPGAEVVSVLILAAGNPAPEVAAFTFTALSGKAQASTRIRLAKTQDVIAIAKMADGSSFMDKREVKVTIGGCGG